MPPAPLYDDHVHSCFSIDGHDSVEDLCRAAAGAGLAGLTLTDHFDTEPSDLGYGRYDHAQIARAVEHARREVPGLDLGLGAEICFQAPFARRVRAFLRACLLDFCLGSAHYVRHEFVDPAFFAQRSATAAYGAYLGAVEDVVSSGLFDALAHLDLAKRHGTRLAGPFDPEPHWPRIERILRGLIEQGMALEINASGWRQGPGEPYPGEAILARYRALGGTRITVGSDAHRARRVGDGVHRAYDLARRLGFTHVTRYRERRPELVPVAPHT